MRRRWWVLLGSSPRERLCVWQCSSLLTNPFPKRAKIVTIQFCLHYMGVSVVLSKSCRPQSWKRLQRSPDPSPFFIVKIGRLGKLPDFFGITEVVRKADLEFKFLDSQARPQHPATNTLLDYTILSLCPLFSLLGNFLLFSPYSLSAYV